MKASEGDVEISGTTTTGKVTITLDDVQVCEHQWVVVSRHPGGSTYRPSVTVWCPNCDAKRTKEL